MKIALIDCKVNWKLLYPDIVSAKNIIVSKKIDSQGKDILAHSALVINMMDKYKAEKIECHVYEIMDSLQPGRAELVIDALEDIVGRYIRIVMIPLTVNNPERNHELEQICRWACEKNIIIFAASSNRGYASNYPADFDSVIGVRQGAFRLQPFYCWHGSSHQIIGDATPEFVYAGNGRYKLFGGTSKATPKMVGVVQKAVLSGCENLGEMREYLKIHSLAESDNRLDMYKQIAAPKLMSGEMLAYIVQKRNEFCHEATLSYEDAFQSSNLISHYLNDADDVDLFLKYVLQEAGLNQRIDTIRFEHFMTMHHLANYIFNQIKSK